MASEKVASKKEGGFFAPLSSLADNLPMLILRLVLLAILDAWAIWFGWQMIYSGSWTFGVMLWLVVLVINVVMLRSDAAPMRWIVPGLALMAMMHIYPVLFTVYTSFTNYGDGHLIEKPVSIRQIESRVYLPEGADTYSWVLYSAEDGSFGLWLTGTEGDNYFVTSTGMGASAQELEAEGASFNDDGTPVAVGEYTRVPQNRVFATLSEIQDLTFGPEVEDEEAASDVPTVRITSPSAAAAVEQKYVWDQATDTFTDQETGELYYNVEGTYTSESGDTLIPGHPVTIGAQNYVSLLTNPALRGPLVIIFLWTVAFAFLSVFSTFALGLLFALVLNDPAVPFRRAIRVLMIVPYAIPVFVSVLIWRGMFNSQLGIIGSNWNPGWFTDPFWAKVGILTINLWLGYAYMFLITTGALQGIPGDVYEAATVDGAGGLYTFRRITLPLLLISVGPLLIGSFAFNFNNFTIIDLYNQGGPPIAGTLTPAGHTDILISYTYKLAFGGGRGADYGMAAAISVIIFLIVAVITIFNFRYTGMLEESSENV